MPIFRHLMLRQWRLILSVLVAAAFAVPAFAQQPPGADQSAAPPVAATPTAPTPPKPKKHKAATTPSTNNPSDTARAPAAPPAAATGGAKPTLLGQYGDWGAYAASPGGKKVCFAIAKSARRKPIRRTAAQSVLFVRLHAARGKSQQRSVGLHRLSIQAELGSNGRSRIELICALHPAGRRLDQERCGRAEFGDAMRTAQNAVVKGVSAKGTHTTDTFSLRGFAQALDRTGQECK